MTCANGASVRSGISPTSQVLVDRSLWEAVTGAPSSWFDWLLDIFVPQTITAADLCALNLSDPVLPPVSTLAAAFFKDPSSILTVYNYIRDKLRYSAFAAACVCNAASGCNSPQLNPASMTNWGCASPLQSIGTRFTNLGATMSGGWVETGPTGGTTSMTVYLWDVTGPALIAGPQVVSGSGANVRFAWNWTGGPIALVTGRDYVLSFDKGGSSCYPAIGGASPPSVATYYTGIDQRWASGSGTFPTTTGLGVQPGLEPTICGPGGTSTPVAPIVPTQPADLPVPPAWACTTIGDICTRLLQMNQKLDWLIRSLPVVTSSSVAEGTVHAGLTGTGTLAVSGILGVRVLLTTIPSQYGQQGANPVLHYNLGRISWLHPEGWSKETWLNETPLVTLSFPVGVTTIGYSLSGGVVATIVELVKGP